MRAPRLRHAAAATVLMLFTLRPSPARAQFPITESFAGATSPGWSLKGSAVLTADGHGDTSGNGWLRLTDATTNQAGTAYYDTAFPSTYGIVATFDYADHGGTHADGFSVFLVDGATADPTVGASGGPLGYAAKVDSTAPNSCTTGPQTVRTLNGSYLSGVTNGYVGIGFDEYGNFSNCEAGYASDGQLHPQSVAIRGSGTSGTGSQTSFRYLTGKTVTPDFTIDGVERTAPRRVRVSIINKVIKVEMDLTGTGASYQTIIPGYDLSTAPGQAAMPATFKLGISGSTGGSTNTHEIRNVRIEKPVQLSLGQTVSPTTSVFVGDPVTYTLTLANDATNVATGTTITDHFPSGLSAVQWSCTATGGASLPAMSGNGDLAATATLPRSSSLTCTVTGTVAASALGTTLTNVVDVAPPAGAANLLSSSANSALVVAYRTATTLASSVPASVYGQPTTLTATVAVTAGSATPIGTVTFYDGATALGAPVAADGAGRASLTVSGLSVGGHTITARFQGTTRFAPSEATAAQSVAQSVSPASTTIALSPSANPGLLGLPVTFTAQVAAVAPGGFVPDGAVTFLDGAVALGTVAVDETGTASFTTSALTLGGHLVSARYSGSTGYLASTSPTLAQAIILAPTATLLAASANPSAYGQGVTLTAQVIAPPPSVGVPAGTVRFYDGATLLGAGELDAAGQAQLLLLAPSLGGHAYAATYDGDALRAGSASAVLVQTVNAASTATALSGGPNPAVSGQAVTWTATVAVVPPGAGVPTGDVELRDGSTVLATAPLSGGAATFTLAGLSAGDHGLTAHFTGSTLHAASASAMLRQVVNRADSATSVAAAPAPSTFGQPVTFTVTVAPVSPGVGTPTGSVSLSVGAVALGSRALGAGKATFTSAALPAGSYALVATYEGDGAFAGSTGAGSHTVNLAATGTALVSGPEPSAYGQLVTLAATVSTTAPGAGIATGTVTFRGGATVLGAAALDADGVARLSTTLLPAGARSLTASYAGDGDHLGSTSAAAVQTVDLATTSMAIASSLPTSTFGDEVVLTAAVTPVLPGAGLPSGVVTFLVDGAPIGTGALVNGVATLRTAALPAGAPVVTASYGGDAGFAPCAGGDLTQLVSKASVQVTVTSSTNPVVVGEPLTLTATVSGPSGAPGGTVTFRDGSTVLCQDVALVNGVATCAAVLTVGPHAITATASGDADHAPGSTSVALTETVSAAGSATALVAAPTSSVFGQAVTLTATVTSSGAGAGTPTGTVTFQEGAAVLGSATLDAGGVARLALSTAAVGGHPVTAAYAGDDRHQASTSAAATFTVGTASTATALAASVPAPQVGQPFTLSATVTVAAPGAGAPGGTVTFRDGTASLGAGSVGAGGVATLAISGLDAGPHALTAEYGGDDRLSGSTSTALSLSVAVAPTTTTVAAVTNPVVYGQPASLRVQVAVPGPGTGTPSGAVTVEENGTVLGTGTISSGAASLTLAGLEPGAHALVARFPGDDRLGASASACLTLTVNPASTRVALVATPSPVGHGEALTLTATVEALAPGGGVPAGAVTFSDGGTSLGTATLDTSGRAAFTTRALAIGGHGLTAAYAGSARHQAGASPSVALTVERDPVTVTVASSRNPTRHGRSVTFTVTAAAGGGAPDGAVTLRDGDAVLATLPLADGAATFTTRDLVRGTHAITAEYAGSPRYAPSTGALPGGEVVENSPPVAGAGSALALGPDAALRARLPAPAAANPAAGTVELWLRAGWTLPEDVGAAPSILVLGPAASPRLALGLSPDRRTLTITTGAAAAELPAALDDGRWHHLAVSADGRETQVIVDGLAMGSVPGGLGQAGPDGPGEVTVGEGFTGAIDELRIWTSARSSAEIEAARWRILRGDEAGLAGLWRFDEGGGAEVFDAGPDHLDGAAEPVEGGLAFAPSGAWEHRVLPVEHALQLDAGYDPDGDALTVTLGDAPALGVLRAEADARLRYDAPAQEQGLARLVWTVDDGASSIGAMVDVEVIGAMSCQTESTCPSGDMCLSGLCTMPEKVVARSGAGCGAGSAGSGALWAALAVLLLLARRVAQPAVARRARRAGASLALLLAAAPARAQSPEGFALQTLEPSPPGDRFLSLPDASTDGHLRPGLALTGAWTDRPLVLKQNGHEVPGGHVVDRALWAWAQGSLALLDRVVVDAAIPVALAQDGAKPIRSLDRVSRSAFGDLRLGARAGLPLPLPLHVALGVDVWLPTGKRQGFASDGAVRALPKLLASGEVRSVVWAAELGVLVRRDEDLGVLTRTGSAFHYGVGVAYRFGELQVGPELFGRKQFRGTATSPAEALLGVRWRGGPFELGGGVGTALNDSPGAAPLRVVVRIGWSPGSHPASR